MAALLALLFQASEPLTATEFEILEVRGQVTLRRLGWVNRPVAKGLAAGVVNGDFSAGLQSWTTEESGGSELPGEISTDGGSARILEGDSFLVSLSQEFRIPGGADELTFTLSFEPGFDLGDSFLPDAFEVSLLDAELESVLPVWTEEASSFLNFQESGAVNRGAGVEWDGQRATVDLSGLEHDGPFTLHFDLIGGDSDTGTALEIDDVEVRRGPGGKFVRGDASGDDLTDITDAVAILLYLFIDATAVKCLDAADIFDDGLIEITDSVQLLTYLFLGGPPPSSPFPGCGTDPRLDTLGCEDGGSCS